MQQKKGKQTPHAPIFHKDIPHEQNPAANASSAPHHNHSTPEQPIVLLLLLKSINSPALGHGWERYAAVATARMQ